MLSELLQLVFSFGKVAFSNFIATAPKILDLAKILEKKRINAEISPYFNQQRPLQKTRNNLLLNRRDPNIIVLQREAFWISCVQARQESPTWVGPKENEITPKYNEYKIV